MFPKIIDLIISNSQYLFPIIIILLFAVLISFIIISLNLNRLNRRYNALTTGTDGKNLENLLFHYVEEVKQTTNLSNSLMLRVKKLEDFERIAFKELGLVKFDAFDDASGKLSFSLALLNEQKNGLILSNICSRSESRIYIKPVTAGQSPTILTDEEKEAIAKASVLK